MAGIYIHIPYCKTKCHYCNFYSLASKKYFDDIMAALSRELVLRKGFLPKQDIQSIYFGGGTPSLVSVSQLDKILQTIHQQYNIADNAEITLEANPDDLHSGIIREYKALGINRLSMGVQSFHDDELAYLNRIHSSRQAVESVEQSRSEGITNITIDLIYGLPESTPQKWQENLNMLKELSIPHLSAYALTVEPGTALHHFIRKGKIKAPGEEMFLEQFQQLQQFADDNGYEHYEISNFCQNKQYAGHNTAYWLGKPYLGIGPSAHSFDGKKRTWNIASLKAYLTGINNANPNMQHETLNMEQHYNEFVMTRLRTSWGVSIKELKSRFPEDFSKHFFKAMKKHLENNLLYQKEDAVLLSRKGIMVSDSIISDFFMEE